MRICKNCRFAEKMLVDSQRDMYPHKGTGVEDWYCTHPDEEKIETDYVTGERKYIYPTCQDMRLSRGGVVNYCGAEGRFYEGVR